MNMEVWLNQMPNMSPVLWGAAFSMALGATFLVLAIVTQLRRLALKTPALHLRNPLAGLGLHRPKTEPSPQVEATETGYRAASFQGPRVTSAPPVTESPEIQILASRLSRVAETLVQMKANMRPTLSGEDFSALKPEDYGVEYLYKTTSG